jgi:HlyD family secretion protein
MDVKRDPAILKRKRIRQGIFLAIGAVAVLGISVAVMRLKPAAQSVPASTLWYGTVKRGSFTREVRGAGTLVPEDIRWIPATTSGRVEKIVLQPGAQVRPDSVVLELSNPDLTAQVNAAKMTWAAGKAQLENQKATMRSTRISQESSVADAKSQLKLAQAELTANQKLAKDGLIADFVVQQKQAAVDSAQNRLDVAEKTLDISTQNQESQLAPQEATVEQQQAAYNLLVHQLDDLHVKANMTGQLQLLGPSVEVGAQIGPGTNLIRVSNPKNLKAQVRISETQTKDLAIGQPATIDTRNGIVKGHVTRIDPASNAGTVGVDVAIDEPLPPGARPDLSVDGVIQLQKLENVLYVERPTFGQENATVGLFKLLSTTGPVAAGQEAGHEAVQESVKLGSASVQFIQVLQGLSEGDKVILSDMSQYDAQTRIKLN